jgi:hypothetical protein
MLILHWTILTHRFKPMVESDRQEGNRLSVDGPHFFINNHVISGGISRTSST